MAKKVRKAVFPAAGLGTRFLPATKSSPKEMLPLVDKPLIQYVVEEAVASGIESVIIVTGRDKTAIEDHFDVSFELEKILEERGKTEELAQMRRDAASGDLVDLYGNAVAPKDVSQMAETGRVLRKGTPNRAPAHLLD